MSSDSYQVLFSANWPQYDTSSRYVMQLMRNNITFIPDSKLCSSLSCSDLIDELLCRLQHREDQLPQFTSCPCRVREMTKRTDLWIYLLRFGLPFTKDFVALSSLRLSFEHLHRLPWDRPTSYDVHTGPYSCRWHRSAAAPACGKSRTSVGVRSLLRFLPF